MEESTEESLSLHFNTLIKSNESFPNSSYDNFLKKGFSSINPGYLDSLSENLNSKSDKVNNLNFIGNSQINDDVNSFEKIEKEEKASNNQNDLIIEIENKNNNLEKREKPLISKETISQNKSNKGKKLLGRKKKEDKVNQPEGSSHDMYSNDNISIKTQTHFLNFITLFHIYSCQSEFFSTIF